MARKEYDPEVKAAVMAALLAGQSVNAVAKEYKIPKGTVSSWAKREAETLDRVRQDAVQQATTGQPVSEVGSLLLDLLTSSLRSLKNQTEVMGEKEYLRKQPLQEVAVSYGIQMDKAVRLIEALDRAESRTESPED